MPDFDYEKSIWGRETATLSHTDPANFRLRESYALVRGWPHGRILEVGCGAGRFIRALKQLNRDLEAHGVDISVQAIGLAREARDGVIYAVAESDKLPYADGYFDAVFIYDVLEHLANPAGLLREVNRVLNPDGLFYAFVPCEGDWTSFWYWLDKIGLKKDLTRKYAGHINYFSRRELFALMEKNNFLPLEKKYSEHFLGQLLGVVAFWLTDRYARKNNSRDLNNEMFFTATGYKRLGWLRALINRLITWESYCWARLPSPNVHSVWQKKI